MSCSGVAGAEPTGAGLCGGGGGGCGGRGPGRSSMRSAARRRRRYRAQTAAPAAVWLAGRPSASATARKPRARRTVAAPPRRQTCVGICQSLVCCSINAVFCVRVFVITFKVDGIQVQRQAPARRQTSWKSAYKSMRTPAIHSEHRGSGRPQRPPPAANRQPCSMQRAFSHAERAGEPGGQSFSRHGG